MPPKITSMKNILTILSTLLLLISCSKFPQKTASNNKKEIYVHVVAKNFLPLDKWILASTTPWEFQSSGVTFRDGGGGGTKITIWKDEKYVGVSELVYCVGNKERTSTDKIYFFPISHITEEHLDLAINVHVTITTSKSPMNPPPK